MAKEVWILKYTTFSDEGKKEEEIIGFTDTAIDMFNYIWDFIEVFVNQEEIKKFQEILFNTFKEDRTIFGIKNFLIAEKMENLIKVQNQKKD